MSDKRRPRRRKPVRLTSSQLITAVLDDGTWQSWDETPLAVAEEGSPYAADLAAAAEKSGVDESIVTGEGRIGGHRVAVIAGEFTLPRRAASVSLRPSASSSPSSGPPASACRSSRPPPPAAPACRKALPPS